MKIQYVKNGKGADKFGTCIECGKEENSREHVLMLRDRNIVREQPTVEAISKDQYENRLKADMVAMLTELKKEIDGIPINSNTSDRFKLGQAIAYDKCEFLIQQKIDVLKKVVEDGKA